MSLVDIMMGLFRKKQEIPGPDQAIAGRDEAVIIDEPHRILRTPLMPDYPEDCHMATFAMGCFWGVEKVFWELSGVYTTAVGYSGGHTKNPTYEEVCSGRTGHAEVVHIVYWPNKIRYQQLLELFWSNHNPTQGMRQGNDRGTQYRSAIYWHNEEQEQMAITSLEQYQATLEAEGGGTITTEIAKAGPLYLAEQYHQQYLVNNPDGYCNMQTVEKSGLPRPDLALA